MIYQRSYNCSYLAYHMTAREKVFEGNWEKGGIFNELVEFITTSFYCFQWNGRLHKRLCTCENVRFIRCTKCSCFCVHTQSLSEVRKKQLFFFETTFLKKLLHANHRETSAFLWNFQHLTTVAKWTVWILETLSALKKDEVKSNWSV